MKYKICFANDISGACHKYLLEGEKEDAYLVRPFFVNYRINGDPYVCTGAQVKIAKERVLDFREEEV